MTTPIGNPHQHTAWGANHDDLEFTVWFILLCSHITRREVLSLWNSEKWFAQEAIKKLFSASGNDIWNAAWTRSL